MLIYKTETGVIPQKVVEVWQEFAVNYARNNGLGTKPNPGSWEVPSIIPEAFPTVGLLLWQHDNRRGNCGKIVIQPGYEDIMKMQQKIGMIDGCEEVEHHSGMAVPLHRHPPLLYKGEEFVGSVIETIEKNGAKMYRVRILDKSNVKTAIYSRVDIGDKMPDLLRSSSGMEIAVLEREESSFSLQNISLPERRHAQNIFSTCYLFRGNPAKKTRRY